MHGANMSCVWRDMILMQHMQTYHQGKFSSKTSELQANVQGLSCHYVHVSPCQPHYHANHMNHTIIIIIIVIVIVIVIVVVVVIIIIIIK
jgi:heme/copper-type cytochrome/quinol oxidase subunit 2